MTKRDCLAAICIALFMTIILSNANADEAGRRTALVESIERTIRSTVNIHTEKRQKSIDVVFSAGKSSKINGMGTGVIFDERGYIVTNFHVVQDVERLRVTTFKGTEYDARVIAYDSRQDLAVIKIDPRETLLVMPLGTSSDLMLGENVIAIGNAFGYESTVTTGIISHLSRDVEVNEEQAYKNLIQIDAAINPGNSGGPLLNADGEVIGINVAIRAGAQRIGFAIPIDDARVVMARLINIERHQKTYHGLSTIDSKQGPDRKLVVQSIQANSPAALAGLQSGDVITKSGDVNVVDATDLERSLFGKNPGEQVSMTVLRDNKKVDLNMQVAQLSSARSQPGQQTLVNVVNKPVTPDLTVEARTWEVFGVKLQTLPGEIKLTGQPYRGGMQVTEVRGQSPAETNGIRKGDILVGLHHWETVNEENIQYVLDHPQLKTLNPIKFYILRDGETLFGHFRIVASH